MIQVIDTTKHRNGHAIVEIYNNVTFVIKLLVTEKVFEETLSRGLGDNNKTPNIDLFFKRIKVLTRGIFLQNYIY